MAVLSVRPQAGTRLRIITAEIVKLATRKTNLPILASVLYSL
jgi:hypothetical protein